jgi:hypothetical protein
MSKLICEYCKYANLITHQCYIGGWERCEGYLFVDSRIEAESVNFARFIDTKTGTDNTALIVNENTSITYEQLYNIYDTQRNLIESTIDFKKKPLKPNYNKNIAIIKVGAGDYQVKSLGDFLAYSKLPRLLKQSGYKSVFLSAYTPFRTESIGELIMTNPYIDGIVDIKPLDENNIDILFANNRDNQRNIMGYIHEAYGFESKEPLTPELWYRPKEVSKYKDAIIYDPNCHTNICGVTVDKLTNYFSENNVKIDYQLQPRERYSVILPNVPIIESKDIFNWIDILYTAKQTYSLFTGNILVMSAIIGIGYKTHTAFYVEGTEPYADFWKFDNINYVTL